MSVVYSERFGEKFAAIAPSARRYFQLVDTQVKQGNLSVLRNNAWVYYISIAPGVVAWGSVMPDGKFFWRDLCGFSQVPLIL